MKKNLLLFCALFFKQILFAQFATPTIDGSISANEYGTHTNGFNQQSSSLNWFMTWDNTYLYVAVSNYNNTNDALVFYIDHNPLATVNGGTNTNGSLTGTGYDGLTTTLPFRADFFAYLKPGYDDYKYHNGSGAWGSSTTGSLSKSNVSTVFEVRIPWSAVTNGGGRPASFNFLCFAGYNTGLFAQLPTQNPGGTVASVTLPYYYSVSTTANSIATKPYSQVSFASNSGFSSLSSSNNLFDFTLNSSSASLSAAQSLAGTLTVTNGGSLTTGGFLTLKSTATTTASIATLGGTISGTVKVERYIPGGRRSSRFLGNPFNSSLSMASLIDNIYITGDGTTSGSGGPTPGAGFDPTTTNAASSFWFDNATQSWKSFTSTSDASWSQYQGVRVLVRGDRTQPTALTGGNPTPNAVTLDMTGTLNTGNQTITVPTGYSVFGNPYPSPVNLGARLSATTNIGTQFWYWDAQAGPTAGAYRTKLVGSAASLPMCGAFVVQPTASTSIAFVEADKTSTDTTIMFRTNTQSGVVELQILYNNYHADNMFVRFNNNSNDSKDALDGEKLNNPEVNLYALSNDSKKLSLDTRPFAENKIIPLGFTATAANSFKIKVADYGITEETYLKDKYLNTTTQLFAGTEYSFSVDPAIPATLGENRFELMMKTNSALPATFLNVAASQKNAGIEVSFTTANETNMSNYEVEESVDGVNFTKATSIAAKNAVSNTYSWFDATVINGDNFYRIKSIEKNGANKYSNVVKVKIGGKGAGFTVYPNPVKGGVVSLQMSNVEKGIYTVKIYNSIGQEVANQTINHNGGSATQTIDLGKTIPSGTYNMQITNGTTTVVTKTVIVE